MWFMLFQHKIDHPRHDGHLRGVPATFEIDRCVPGRKKQHVLLAKRNVQRLGQTEEQLPAGNTASAFYKTNVALRNACIQRQIKLALPALSSPVAQEVA